MPSVYVTRPIPEMGLRLLESECEVHVWDHEYPPPKETVVATLADIRADGILCNVSDQVDAAVLTASESLKTVSTFSVGYDHIDLDTARELGISVGHTPGVLTETTADLAWSLLTAGARRVIEGNEVVRQGNWSGWGPMLLTGHHIHGAALGIIGLGKIGTATARRSAGFDMDVYYCHRERKEEAETELAAAGVDVTRIDRDELLATCDYVSLHVPLLDETRQLIGEPELRRMQSDAILVNTARGEVVDTDALDRALREEWIAGAALDVTDPEPLPTSHPLLEHEPEKLVLTPHIGSASIPTRNEMARMAAVNLLAGIRGEPPEHSAIEDYEAVER